MTTPRGLQKPRRIALLIPLAIVLLLAGTAVGFALAHLFIKDSPPPAEVHARQVAKGQLPHGRDAYGPEDFVEPTEK